MKIRQHTMRLLLACLVLTPAILVPALSSSADFATDYNSGVVYYKHGEYELAAASFESLVKQYPRDPKLDAAMFWCGQSYIQVGRYADAVAMNRRLIRTYPSSTYRMDALMSGGAAAESIESYPDAAWFFSTAAAEESADDKTHFAAMSKLADIYLRTGDNARAEKVLRHIMADESATRAAREEAELKLNQILERTGRGGESRPRGNAGLRVSEAAMAEDYMRRGDDAFAAGRFGESRSWYEEIRRRDSLPSNFRISAIYKIARTSMAMGEIEKARTLFSDIVASKDALPGDRADAALQLARIYRDAGRWQEADDAAANGERIAQWAGLSGVQEDVLFFRAETAYHLKDFDGCLERLVRLNESSHRAQRLKGLALSDLGRFAEAQESLDRAVNTSPDDASRRQIYLHLAQNSYRAKQYEDVIRHLDQVRHPPPAQAATSAVLRADALMALGRFRDAAALYGGMAAEASDSESKSRYRYMAALASFKERNFSWAEKLLTDLSTMGMPAGGMSDPAAFLEAATEVDNAIEFAMPGRSAALEDQLDQILANAPSIPLYLLALERLQSKERYESMPKYAQAAQRMTRPPDEFFGKVVRYRLNAARAMNDRSGEWKALEDLKKWVVLHPKSDIAGDVDIWRADLALRTGESAMAQSAYASYLKEYPDGRYAGRAHLGIGKIAYQAGRLKDADAAFQKVLAGKSATQITADSNLAQVSAELASIRMRQNRASEALSLLVPLDGLESYRADPSFTHMLATAHVATGDCAGALPYLRRLADRRDAPADIQTRAVESIFACQNPATDAGQMEKDYRRYGERIRNPAFHAKMKYEFGMKHYRAGRYNEAVPYLESITEPAESDQVLEAKVRLADISYQRSDFAGALDIYTRIVRVYPDSKWADECRALMELCKAKVGRSADALAGYEQFLKRYPNSPLAPSVLFEAAKLYLKGEDVDAAERSLIAFEKNAAGEQLRESMRMRIDISKRRGHHAQVIEHVRAYREKFGMMPAIAADAAVAATRAGIPYDAFDIAAQKDVNGAARVFESILASGGAQTRTLAIDETFYGSSRDVDVDNTLRCSVKRIIYAPSQIVMLIDARAVSFTSDAVPVSIRSFSYSGVDIVEVEGGFMTGLQIGQDFKLGHGQTRFFAVSIPRNYWRDDAVIGMEIEFARKKIPLSCRMKKKSE